MKCIDCPHFKILYGPLGKGPDIWDFGRAKCEKYDAYVDFASKRKLNKMECIQKSVIWGGISAERVLPGLQRTPEEGEEGGMNRADGT